MVPVKPYRRHAAVTPLELRGAISMLESARKHIVRSVSTHGVMQYSIEQYGAFVVLTQARLDVQRQLESI